MRSATRCTQHEADAAGCSGGQHIHERTVYTRAPEPATSWRTSAMLGTPVTASIVIDFAKPRGCTRELPRDMPVLYPPVTPVTPESNIFLVKMVDEMDMTGASTENTRVRIEPSGEALYPWKIHVLQQPRELRVVFLTSSAVYPGFNLDFHGANGMWYRCDYRDVLWEAGKHDSFLMYIQRASVERFETLIEVEPYEHTADSLEKPLVSTR